MFLCSYFGFYIQHHNERKKINCLILESKWFYIFVIASHHLYGIYFWFLSLILNVLTYPPMFDMMCSCNMASFNITQNLITCFIRKICISKISKSFFSIGVLYFPKHLTLDVLIWELFQRQIELNSLAPLIGFIKLREENYVFLIFMKETGLIKR